MIVLINTIREALGTLGFLYLYIGALILVFIFLNDKRKLFVAPCILITLVIINPFFLKIWNEVNDYGYWRTLWVVPIIPICAVVPAFFVDKVNKNLPKAGIVVIFMVLFGFVGSYVFNHPLTTFIKAENAEKLPNDCVEVADALFELSETPSIVADNELCVYFRQYSGKIRSLFARDITWGTAGQNAKKVYEQLTSDGGNLSDVAGIMLNYDYEYLVTDNENPERDAALREAGFVLVKQVKKYGIYHVTGNPTEIRTYDERYKTKSLTYVDKDGSPSENTKGITTIIYEYDRNGRGVKAFYHDADGNVVTDVSGKAGYEREYNWYSQIVKEVWIGLNGEPVEADGYAMRTCVYNRDRLLESEKYYNELGEPMLRTDMSYAEKKIIYDDNGNIIKECYFGLDGQAVRSSSGYASVNRIYDENERVIHEWYEDEQGKGIPGPDGYCGVLRKYDEYGNKMEEQYLDAEGHEMIGKHGYGKVCREYDTNGRLVREMYYDGDDLIIKDSGYASFIRFYNQDGEVSEERFFDEKGNPVIVNKGYASVKYTYDDQGRKKEELYYDTEGNPAAIGVGYAKCRYIYTNEGQLSLVYYLDSMDNKLEAGSGYLHEYLQSLKGRDVSIFIAVKGEASKQITVTLYEDMKELGIQTDLRGKDQKSFYAVIMPEETVEELGDDTIFYNGVLGDLPYSVMSAGHLAESDCSIIINGIEYAKKNRGLNIVIFDNEMKTVVDSVRFDTSVPQVVVTR